MFAEMGIQPSAFAVARHYSGILSGLMIDLQDAEQASEIEALGIEVVVENIVMKDRSDRRRLAERVLEFGKILVGKGAGANLAQT